MPAIIISYGRKDATEIAQRLCRDLHERGLDAWLDTVDIHSGDAWTSEIERNIDNAEILLALLSRASYESDICRAEQLRALRKQKCVIPLIVQTGTDIPLHLEMKQYLDFSATQDYPEQFEKLVADIGRRAGVVLKPEYRETYVTAPPLPVNYVKRPEALSALRDALLGNCNSRQLALTALGGMGGIGKTVLARALCADEVVQQAFPDGIVWLTIGKESREDLSARMREVAKVLGEDPKPLGTDLAAIN